MGINDSIMAELGHFSHLGNRLYEEAMMVIADWGRPSVMFKPTMEASSRPNQVAWCDEEGCEELVEANPPSGYRCKVHGSVGAVITQGDKWTPVWEASYGDVSGYGDTPEAAARDFDEQWRKQTAHP